MPGVPLSLDVAVAGPVYCQRAVYGHHQSGAVKKGKRLNGAMWFGKGFYGGVLPSDDCSYCLSANAAGGCLYYDGGIWIFFLLLSFLLYIPQYNNLFREYREEQELLKQPQEPKGSSA